ncbi:MAG: hypothetical protein NTV23_16580 [Propionibacteriales bacterium]|nr:hypothetical protein [Propionibacteriales bacterium]
MSEDWRADLADAVARGLTTEGWDAVVDVLGALGDDLAAHPDAPIEPLAPAAPVLGLVPCEAGCLGVLLNVDGHVTVYLGRSARVVVAQVQETTDPGLLVLTGEDDESHDWSGFATESVAPYDGAATTEERRELLRQTGFSAPAWFSGSGFTEAELLDACGAVVVALGRTGRMTG